MRLGGQASGPSTPAVLLCDLGPAVNSGLSFPNGKWLERGSLTPHPGQRERSILSVCFWPFSVLRWAQEARTWTTPSRPLCCLASGEVWSAEVLVCDAGGRREAPGYLFAQLPPAAASLYPQPLFLRSRPSPVAPVHGLWKLNSLWSALWYRSASGPPVPWATLSCCFP